jgi:hypothetical protein
MYAVYGGAVGIGTSALGARSMKSPPRSPNPPTLSPSVRVAPTPQEGAYLELLRGRGEILRVLRTSRGCQRLGGGRRVSPREEGEERREYARPVGRESISSAQDPPVAVHATHRISFYPVRRVGWLSGERESGTDLRPRGRRSSPSSFPCSVVIPSQWSAGGLKMEWLCVPWVAWL